MSASPTHRRIGRIPVVDVAPVVDGGNRPAKSVVGEEFEVTATVFREGHDAVNATVVLVDPAGRERRLPMTRVNAGLDAWAVTVSADSAGLWSYGIEGWSDPYGTWNHDAVIKVGAGVDVELMLEEGARVLERAVAEVVRTKEQVAVLDDAAAALRDTATSPEVRLNAGLSSSVVRELRERPLREHVSATPRTPWLVERERALYGAWYEFFPRSEGAHFDEAAGGWVSGTFRTAAERLDAVAGMGFDVIYLTPIHPIGRINRKGANNSLRANESDPGSPYAIGSADGGHDAIHPDLGTFDDFDAFVERARGLGMEVALDIALNCAPDHPWVAEHPEWFTTRADGSIAYAENPPKKYQDIYPLNFDNDPEGIYAEVRRIIQLWIDHGVTIFRVDNPHTKPVEFWEWLIADVAQDHPEIIWLAEAFTRPPMMHNLAKVGFQQSYTYYAWRHSKAEIEEYLRELSGPAAAYMRPSFWPTTHDILTPFMQRSGPPGWVMRAALAATLVPTYGIYAGYELVENVARPGAEEQIDNEKYQYKNRRWAERGEQSLAPFLTRLNEIRRAHPALHWLRNLRFHSADDPEVLVFSKARRVYDRDDVILVVANLDPSQTRETTIRLDMPELGLGWTDTFVAHDLITGQHWNWGQNAFVRLGPETEAVHIIHVRPY
ncbi:alpha-1,4-glucan--maltose-1-phosphate maltosyltransferase [Actinoplanes sp. LDG1-06]|uniref:Alpha-1,4-glucan:maltose-1-phosphate maltosyltransferase n=1 Tax=Paractinoplanes ovalisporus TaxID=2810368 RepID=A0ABS2AL27_9ACTN|nr:alpha-1,4-glucan--maltose-1-phosphate maltosyltransferase [Actinoplanes ovalisporus]MBM2620567.1 alpha-1,4-glucan--maltose-1-phosphate maltosyltransferase [Actinoplanes ovalisporus]